MYVFLETSSPAHIQGFYRNNEITEKEILCAKIAGYCHDQGQENSNCNILSFKNDKKIIEYSINQKFKEEAFYTNGSNPREIR